MCKTRSPGRKNFPTVRENKMRSPILFRNGRNPIHKPRRILLCVQVTVAGRKNLLENISRQWARVDAQAAIAWVSSLPSASRDSVLPGIIASVAETDLPEATRLVARLPAGDSQANAASSIGWQWAGDDPQAASKWAASFPEGKTRQRAFESVMNRWSQNDPYAAGSWLGTLPAGDSRDAAVNAYTGRIMGSDPAAAVQWAQTISDESMRNSRLESLLGTWLKTDANAATNWISASALPEETKMRLLPKR